LPISVKVRLLGVFRGLVGVDRLSVEVEHLNVRDVIGVLVDSVPEEAKKLLIDPELNDPRPNALILLNGREISVLKGLETKVNDGDEVALIPVAHGG